MFVVRDLNAPITLPNVTGTAIVCGSNWRMPWQWFGMATNESLREKGNLSSRFDQVSWTMWPAGLQHHFRVSNFSEQMSTLVNAYCDEIETRLGVVVAFKTNRLAFARLHRGVVPGGRPRGSPLRLWFGEGRPLGSPVRYT